MLPRSAPVLMAAMLVAAAVVHPSVAKAVPKPDPDGQVRVAGIPASMAAGDVITLDLTGSRLGPGSCVRSVTTSWGSPSGQWTAPAVNWLDPVDRTGQRCNGRPPEVLVDVRVPEEFAGGSLIVKLTSFPTKAGQPSTATWASTTIPVRIAQPNPIARLFAQSVPASGAAPLVMDARGSADPLGQSLRFEWDLDGNGSFGDDPGSAEPGIAVIPVSRLQATQGLVTSTPRAAALIDPGQLAQGLTRMRACQPTSDAFVSLEVAPEVIGRPPVRAGMHRLWDMKVTWRDLNPERGRFEWGLLDQRIRQAEQAGAKVLLVLGMTPQWAAADPNAGNPRWGAGSASPPRDLEDWRAYVEAVVDRYGSRIAAYEVWNEASLRTFWTGTAHQMADLTAIAYRAIKARQPDATVLAASVTTRLARPMELFMNQYLDSLGGHAYPFDAFAIHTYPAGNAGADARVADITNWQQVVVERVGPDSPVLDKQVWDTEVNYGLAGPGPRPGTSFTDQQGAELITRTYVDSHRLGIDATFWYMYTAQPFSLLGVQLWSGTPLSISAWTALRQRFAAGANPCSAPGSASVPVAVRVVASDGRSSTTAVDAVASTALSSNGSIQAPAVLHAPGAPIAVSITSPPGPVIACLDATGSGRFDRPIGLAGTTGSTTILAPSTPGSHRLSVAFWSPEANPGCATASVAANRPVQVASTIVNVGGAPAPGAVPGRLWLGPGKVVASSGTSQAGAQEGLVLRGSYELRLRNDPAALRDLSRGSFVARLESAWAVQAAGSGKVSAIGQGYLLMQGQGRAGKEPRICMQLDLAPGRAQALGIGGSKAGSLLSLSVPKLAVMLTGGSGQRIGRSDASLTARLLPGQASMPAACASLVRYLP